MAKGGNVTTIFWKCNGFTLTSEVMPLWIAYLLSDGEVIIQYGPLISKPNIEEKEAKP